MTKAEQAAMRAYPPQFSSGKRYAKRVQSEMVDTHAPIRKIFLKGYEQAEQDLGWISVKDRLPDTTEYVFTCIKMDGIPQCVGFHYYKDGKWWEGYEEDTVGAVEYWMQIPQFKEAKNDGNGTVHP